MTKLENTSIKQIVMINSPLNESRIITWNLWYCTM